MAFRTVWRDQVAWAGQSELSGDNVYDDRQDTENGGVR